MTKLVLPNSAACTRATNTASDAMGVQTATAVKALDGITVGGTFKAPKVTFETKPLTVKATTTRVITAGEGARLSKINLIMFSYALFNGRTGKQISSNFGNELAPMDLSYNTMTKAGGVAVQPIAGLPTVIVEGAKPAQITVPKTPAPTVLVVQPLLKGLGAVIKSGQSIKVYYTGVDPRTPWCFVVEILAAT